MPLTTAVREQIAGYVTGLGAYISVHTADPGSAGANEASGGGYARVQTTWSAGASDGVYSGSEVSVTVPAGTYTHGGVWTAASGGTFLGSQPIVQTIVGGTTILKITPSYTQNA